MLLRKLILFTAMRKQVLTKKKRFIINLMLQRTNYLTQNGYSSAIADWSDTGSIKGLCDLLENKTFVKKFEQYVYSEARCEAKAIQRNLRRIGMNEINTLASIGPGNGIVELFLSRMMKVNSLYLIDIETTPDRHYHGTSNTGAGYCNLGDTESFLQGKLKYEPNNDCYDASLDASKLKNKRQPLIVTINPSKVCLPTLRCDLIISLLSAGFHYPIKSYQRFIESSLSVKGLLIYDSRNGTDSNFKLDSKMFLESDPIAKNRKYTRKVLIKGEGTTICRS